VNGDESRNLCIRNKTFVHAGLRRRSAESIEKESLTTKLLAFLELAK
jgi:hypothetical protein